MSWLTFEKAKLQQSIWGYSGHKPNGSRTFLTVALKIMLLTFTWKYLVCGLCLLFWICYYILHNSHSSIVIIVIISVIIDHCQ